MNNTVRTFFHARKPLALTLGAMLAATAYAATSQNRTWSGNTTVDAVTDLTVASLTNTIPTGMKVYNVWVSVTWLKTDGSCSSPGTGSSYHNETGLKLQAPDGTKVTLVNTGQYSGSTSIGNVTTRFYDSYTTAPPSGIPTSGYFRPYQALSTFDGKNARGTWKLLASDTAGADPLCVKAVSLTVYAEYPVTAQAGGPYSVAEGSAPTLTSAGTSGGVINSVQWDCTNNGSYDVTGTTTSSCVYGDNGTYTVKMRATNTVGFESTDTATVTVTNVAPSITAVTVPSTVDEGSAQALSITATDPGNDTITASWNMGDGISRTGTSVNHTWANDGTYNVVITASDEDGGQSQATRTVTVNNVAPSIGTFTLPSSVPEGSGAAVAVVATDPGADTLTYDWDFGDGTGSSASSLTKTWGDDGVYTVSVGVSDDDTTTTQTGTITVTNVAPTLTSITAPDGDEGEALSFAASATDPGADTITWHWNFGDGQTSTSQDPTHTYADDGTYTVTVTANDGDGGVTQDTRTVTVANLAPTLSGVSIPSTVYEGASTAMSVVASDAGSDTLTTTWDFGDGGSATGTSVSHAWGGQGTYTVDVTVTDDEGATGTASRTVTVLNAAPVIDTMTVGTGAEGSAITLQASATDPGGDAMTYTWQLPDGTELTGASTSHVFDDDGSYDVTLVVEDADGGVSEQTATVVVTNADPVIASVTAPDGEEGEVLAFAVTASDVAGDTLTYSWDLGDGSPAQTSSAFDHVYAADGTYTVTVTVNDEDGGSSQTSQTVTIANGVPVIVGVNVPSALEGQGADLSAVVVDPGSDPLTLDWDFGDGTTGSGAAVSHTWADDGTYTVTFTATDDAGATVTSSQTVTVSNLNPTVQPLAAISALEGSAFALSVTASDVAADPLTYDWDLGDGTTATGATPTHTWTDDGTYTVSVTVADDDGGQTIRTVSAVVANVDPIIGSVTTEDGDEGEELALSVVASDPGDDVLSYTWDFGDGTTATGDAVTHTWTDQGTYTVQVTVDDEDGGSTAQTAIVVIDNVLPTLDAYAIAGGDEGSELAFSATVSDPGDDELAISWDFGDGTSASGAEVAHTYADDGDYTVTVTIDDGDGGVVTHSEVITIDNVDPTIDTMVLGDAVEGVAVLLTATGSDVGNDDLTYTWTVDGVSESVEGANAAVILADDGSYDVTLTITDDDGGSVSQTQVLVVANADPVIADFDDQTVSEGTALLLEATVSDVADDTLSYEWDLGDGQVMTTTEPSLEYTWTDDDDYVVTLTVTDEDGGLSVATLTTTVENVDPTIDTVTIPTSADEGSDVVLSITASDPSVDDEAALGVDWTFGDGEVAAGFSVTHAWADDGTYSVVVTVSDDDGGLSSETHTVTIANVAPTFTNSAVVVVFEDEAWQYLPTVDDPGDDELTFVAVDLPDGATLDTSTGQIDWTPDYDDATAGSRDFALRVEDGDGGTDTLEWTVTVYYADDDGDGLADEWELNNGLDPEDPNDATGDADGDGRDNLLEFTLGTDPAVYEGPEAPALVSPKGDVEVLEASPTLLWTNAVHPIADDVITYEVEVYEDDTLAVLLTDVTELAEEELQTSWWVDVALPENTWPVWRVRAVDPYVESAWSEVGRFFVNAVDEAPPVPELLFPIEGQTLALEAAELQFGTVLDPDGDAVTYDVELVDEYDVPVASAVELQALPEAADLSWMVPELLTEDAIYQWRALARDEDGMDAGWSAWTWFRYSLQDVAPDAPEWLEPVEGASVESLLPDLVVTGVVDPEGTAVTYTAELSLSADFSEVGALATAVDDTHSASEVVLALDGELQEHAVWYARVKAEDEGRLASPWTSMSFFVRGPNDAPTVPVPLSPTGESLEAGDPWPDLIFALSTDPEGDEITYDLRLVALPEAVIAEAEGLVLTGNEASWNPELRAEVGDFHWQVRAVDSLGAASAWSEPAPMGVYSLDEEATSGCGCASSGGGAGWVWLGGLGLLGLRRRERR